MNNPDPEVPAKSRIAKVFDSLQSLALAAVVTIAMTGASAFMIQGQVTFHNFLGFPAVVALDAAWRYISDGSITVPFLSIARDYLGPTSRGTIVLGGGFGACVGLLAAINVLAAGPGSHENMIHKKILTSRNFSAGYVVIGLIQLPIGVAVSTWWHKPVADYVAGNLLRSSLCAAAGTTLTWGLRTLIWPKKEGCTQCFKWGGQPDTLAEQGSEKVGCHFL